MNNFGLFVTGYKGFRFLEMLPCSPTFVVTYDNREGSDSHTKIINFCARNNILLYDNKNFDYDTLDTVEKVFVVGWQFLIKKRLEKFIVFHDSFLPEKKGFCPVVSSLLDQAEYLGASCFSPICERDSGELLCRIKRSISYPIKIKDAFDCVVDMFIEMFNDLLNDKLPELVCTDSCVPSYSVWRDEEDLRIDWKKSSPQIKQMVYSLGYPYVGSSSLYDGNLIYIQDVDIVPDLNISNRECHFGKIWDIEEGNPIVVCGKGMLKILSAKDSNGDVVIFKKIRKRFK